MERNSQRLFHRAPCCALCYLTFFINDLFFLVEKSEVCNYADDNSLTVADINLNIIISKLGTDINVLDKWFKNNGTLLNEAKCKFMIFEPMWTSRKKLK